MCQFSVRQICKKGRKYCIDCVRHLSYLGTCNQCKEDKSYNNFSTEQLRRYAERVCKTCVDVRAIAVQNYGEIA